MTAAARLVVSCWVLLAMACGAGDNRLDPSDLELRDLLGISPEIAGTWDADQRAAARRVIDGGLRRTDAVPARAALAGDRSVPRSLAALDRGRTGGALGLVRLELGAAELVATTRRTSLAPRHANAVELRLAGWDGDVLRALPARGLDVLASIAVDAGHARGPLIVVPAPRLAMVAAYVAGDTRLLVNPVLLAALEPSAQPAPAVAARTVTAAANPYTFYSSVEQCATAQRSRCDACLFDNSCIAITSGGDGNAECTELAANQGRGYALICVNLALAIDSVASCTGSRAPTCARDTRASDSMSKLENNAHFVDVPSCGSSLDVCLGKIFGGEPVSIEEPPPRESSSCDDSGCDPSCGEACEDGATACAADDGSSCSDESSSCDDTGSGGSSGGDCGGDSEDACGSSENSGCSDSGGDCSGGESDCSGGGEDCSGGGGGDCSGEGCSVAGKRGRGAGGTLVIAVLWALLPVPFAISARRRADRRKARAEQEARS